MTWQSVAGALKAGKSGDVLEKESKYEKASLNNNRKEKHRSEVTAACKGSEFHPV